MLLKYYLCNGNVTSPSQVWVRATPPYCHTAAILFVRLSRAAAAATVTTTTTATLSGAGPRSLCCLFSTQLCLWLFSQTLHLPWGCRDRAPLTLACPGRSLRTFECSYVIPVHTARFIFSYFDILGNNIWETKKGKNRVHMAEGGRQRGQSGNVVCLTFLREK